MNKCEYLFVDCNKANMIRWVRFKRVGHDNSWPEQRSKAIQV